MLRFFLRASRRTPALHPLKLAHLPKSRTPTPHFFLRLCSTRSLPNSLETIEKCVRDQEFAIALHKINQNLDIDPNDLANLKNKATVLLLLDQPSEALAIFENIIPRIPSTDESYPEILLNKANCLHATRKLEAALKCYEETEELVEGKASPQEMGELLVSKGQVLRDLGDLDGAIEALELALKYHENISGVLNEKGVTLAKASRNYEEFEAFTAAINVDRLGLLLIYGLILF